MVQREGLVDKLSVTADGTGLVGHAGSAPIPCLQGILFCVGASTVAEGEPSRACPISPDSSLSAAPRRGRGAEASA